MAIRLVTFASCSRHHWSRWRYIGQPKLVPNFVSTEKGVIRRGGNNQYVLFGRCSPVRLMTGSIRDSSFFVICLQHLVASSHRTFCGSTYGPLGHCASHQNDGLMFLFANARWHPVKDAIATMKKMYKLKSNIYNSAPLRHLSTTLWLSKNRTIMRFVCSSLSVCCRANISSYTWLFAGSPQNKIIPSFHFLFFFF